MLHELDETIEAFLRGSRPDLFAQADRPVTISFAPPDERFPPPGVVLPAVDFFLFLIEENRELRASEPIVEPQPDGTVIRRPAPVRVDCHYLVTAFSDATQRAEEDEHRLLGEVMQLLLRHRQIPGEFVRGVRLAPQRPPVRSSAILPSPNHGAELWQALKGRPRASLHYVLTISVDAGAPPERLPLVTRINLEGAS